MHHVAIFSTARRSPLQVPLPAPTMPPSSLRWDESQMPPQHGRLAIVTGANTGLGFATSVALARAGAHVILACRNEARGLEAQQRIRDEIKAGNDTSSVSVGAAEYMQLDVGRCRACATSCRPSRRGSRDVDWTFWC